MLNVNFSSCTFYEVNASFCAYWLVYLERKKIVTHILTLNITASGFVYLTVSLSTFLRDVIYHVIRVVCHTLIKSIMVIWYTELKK